MTTLSLSPLLPITAIVILGLIGVAAALLSARRSALGVFFRLLTVALGVGWLLGPQTVTEEGDPLPDIAVLLEDQSASTLFGDRADIIAAARERLNARLEAEGVETVSIPFGDDQETDLNAALGAALRTVRVDELAGVFVLSDGQVHNLPDARVTDDIGVPIHAIVAGDAQDQRDRRVQAVRAPRFGVVGETVELVARIEAPGEEGDLDTTLFVNGEPFATQPITIGREVTITVPLIAPGETILELAVEAGPDELTTLNNRRVLSLRAVRDRLRVLLVSGEPHAGERVWRNTLKSDPAVDLVHFTILKPQNKARIARPEELNLIQFPHEELFLEKLDEFDIVIFDRYTYRGVLQSFEFDRLARYVEAGGALLISAGPEFAAPRGLANQPNLAYILPARPSGRVEESSFVPTRSISGERHPVTAPLENPEIWGRWLRYLPARISGGDVLMTGPDDAALLVLDRVGQGRVGLMLTDQVWLWAREFDGGGPHRELLRRLIHWLMQEPSLEEEALSGQIVDGEFLDITRQSLEDAVAPVTVTAPDGTETDVPLEEVAPGQFAGRLPVDASGLYRLSSVAARRDEPLYAIVAEGDANARERGAIISTDALLGPLAEATGGGVWVLPSLESPLPSIRRVREGAQTAGRDFAGLVRQESLAVTARRVEPILPPWGWAIGLGALMLLAWLAESGRFRRGT